MKELTEKQIEHYAQHVTIQLEDDLDDCRVRRWEVIFDKDYLSDDAQKPAFILHDEKNLLGDIDMNGDMELNNDTFGTENHIERFSSEELMVLGQFGKRLKHGEL